ncbi:PhzF family phenazine biosynthesis protein [Brevibacillus humidisoli]|uniref:PhzF family phenazine biosynthesis protein n=1 Tax=Brevibacillus humidisoli TaxID=2895522 RepID=UPI001E4F2068|nr:PhzF family phenazine biosynthesis protein [Brevibacillus humidisoli]UFJ39464.1 PhzF family phenazine biosynthesis protein [Brevibacillus humidisoli]
MRTLAYTLTDVFTDRIFGGNQLAVFTQPPALSTGEMQAIARELNLSETVFVYEPDHARHHRKLRIFTPDIELPMAGHPTIGTAYVLANEGLIETVEGENVWVFEEGVGDITVIVQKENGRIGKIEMFQPTPVFGEVFHNKQSAAELLSLAVEDIRQDLPIQTVSTGVPFLFIPVQSLAAMRRIHFRPDVWQEGFATDEHTRHIFAFAVETENADSDVHSRMFAPAMGIREDPATGGASGPLGVYLVEHGVVPPAVQGVYEIRSEQGLEMGRPSLIDITVVKHGHEYKQVKVGGTSVKVGEGKLYV